MTDLSQMLRWNAGFVRGLAETVLNRAKTIRSSLNPYSATAPAPVVKKAKPVKTKVKPTRRPGKTPIRRTKKAPITKQ